MHNPLKCYFVVHGMWCLFHNPALYKQFAFTETSVEEKKSTEMLKILTHMLFSWFQNILVQCTSA